MTGILATDIFADIMSALAAVEGYIADVEGAIADFFSIFDTFLTLMEWIWDTFWELLFWLYVLITIWDVIVLLIATKEIWDEVSDDLANIGIFMDTFLGYSVYDFFTQSFSSWWNCTSKIINNLPECLPWYIADTGSKILYMPFTFFFWLICLQDTERAIWQQIYALDCNLSSSFGFSLIHFPDFVIQDCYSCNLDPIPGPMVYPNMKWPDLSNLPLIPYPEYMLFEYATSGE